MVLLKPGVCSECTTSEQHLQHTRRLLRRRPDLVLQLASQLAFGAHVARAIKPMLEDPALDEPALTDPSAAWLAVDCDICGAEFGKPCTGGCACGPDCTSPICKVTREASARGEMYCAGGSRERAELGMHKGEEGN